MKSEQSLVDSSELLLSNDSNNAITNNNNDLNDTQFLVTSFENLHLNFNLSELLKLNNNNNNNNNESTNNENINTILSQQKQHLIKSDSDTDIELVVDKLKLNLLNRTNSTASCSSTNSAILLSSTTTRTFSSTEASLLHLQLNLDSGYISSNDLNSDNQSSSAISTPTSTLADHHHILLNNQKNQNLKNSSQNKIFNFNDDEFLKCKVGFCGKAKSIEHPNSITTSTTSIVNITKSSNQNLIYAKCSSSILLDENKSDICANQENILNFGDDVGLVLNKTEASSSNEFYFCVADGVSANRTRGYDPSLFPIALLNSCAHYILNNSSPELETLNNREINNNSIFNSNNNNTDNMPLVFFTEEQNGEKEEGEEVYDEYDGYLEEEENTFGADFFLDEINQRKEDEENDELLNLSLFTSIEENKQCNYLFNTLNYAHNRVQDEKVYGSSTTCLLSLKLKYKRLHNEKLISYCDLNTLNIGDSAYMIMRNRQAVFKSQTQSHRFNAPFQLGCTPPELLDHDLYRDK
jgi:hypothetical protein